MNNTLAEIGRKKFHPGITSRREERIMARDIHVGTYRVPQSGHLSRTRPLGQGTRQERVTDTPFTFLKIVKNLIENRKSTKVSKELKLKFLKTEKRPKCRKVDLSI